MIFSYSTIHDAIVETTGYFKFHNEYNFGAYLFGDSELTDDILVSF